MGEVLTKVWLKSIRNKRVIVQTMNAQKESLKKLPGFTQAPASPRKSVR